MRKGFLPEVYETLEEFAKDNEGIIFGTIKEITEQFANKIDELI